MVERIGQSSLAKAAIEAALKRQAEAAQRLNLRSAELAGADAQQASSSSFSSSLMQGLRGVDEDVKRSDQLAQQVVEGTITDFAEAAAQLKQTDLAFKFALEVRNKFVDAYREVMRMSV